jgi:O-acetyl-ADP-ribose deacetylase (regulator of RNase III)
MDARIKLQQGDITKLAIDAIVNAANSSLMGGGGVDGAIHRAGGKQILEECIKIVDRQGRCKTGKAVITSGGNLPAKYVIHTVGPVYNGGKNVAKEEEQLANCYTNSLNLAIENGIKTIAFPNISTGVYRFPKQRAAEIATETVDKFLADNQGIDEVIFICFDDENLGIYNNLLHL